MILSPQEVGRLLEAAPGPKYKAAMSAAYSAGLRVSEWVALKVADVDSKRMLLRIEQGKGRKDRLAMLSPRLLDFLRDWYCIARPAVWLFPGRDPMLPMTTRQLTRAVHKGPTSDRSADQAVAGYRHDGSCGNDRYPNGRRRRLTAPPVADSCLRLERGRPKGGPPRIYFSFCLKSRHALG